MSFARPKISSTIRWNWDGDRILHECVVPSSRPVAGYGNSRRYEIDVREFIGSDHNAVMRETLSEDFKSFVRQQRGADWDFLHSRGPGSFDHMSSLLTSYVQHEIRYANRKVDYWQFPDETLFVKEGDCEDRALLLASLLTAAGISPYNVRVALGYVRRFDTGNRTGHFDHCWVMYKDEAGRWSILEPSADAPQSGMKPDGDALRNAKDTVGLEYVPEFVFNGDHLWEVNNPLHTARKRRRTLKQRWSGLHPTFYGEVHRTILNEALGRDGTAPDWWLQQANRNFTILFGQCIDAPDLNLFKYNPYDHFDNGYIDESWELVRTRLDTFKNQPLTDPDGIDSFAKAAHGIGDFYAHTNYAHMAIANGLAGKPTPYDPVKKTPAFSIDYSTDPQYRLGSKPLSTNPDVIEPAQMGKAVAFWKGRIISGRFGQTGDSRGVLEAPCYIPADIIKKDKNFAFRGALPHHNEIAVDKENGSNSLYNRGAYDDQLKWRKDAAVLQIRNAFKDHP